MLHRWHVDPSIFLSTFSWDWLIIFQGIVEQWTWINHWQLGHYSENTPLTFIVRTLNFKTIDIATSCLEETLHPHIWITITTEQIWSIMSAWRQKWRWVVSCLWLCNNHWPHIYGHAYQSHTEEEICGSFTLNAFLVPFPNHWVKNCEAISSYFVNTCIYCWSPLQLTF